jgi:hypothetical protein
MTRQRLQIMKMSLAIWAMQPPLVLQWLRWTNRSPFQWISPFTFTLATGAGGSDNASFSIIGNELRTTESFDFETQSSYFVRIRTTDIGGLWYEEAFVITVTDIDEIAPTVLSITRIRANPTSADSVDFLVTFSEAVTNVDENDFVLSGNDVISASLSPIIGSGNTYTVTVNTGSGNGTIRLDALASVVITDLAANPLTNLPYESGEAYTVLRIYYIYLPCAISLQSPCSTKE